MTSWLQVQASLCNAVVRLKLELYRLPKSVRSAVILDGYNSLFHKSEFWETELQRLGSLDGPLRPVDAQELTLCANLRVLSDPAVGHTLVMAAPNMSCNVPDLPVQLDAEAAPYTRFTVPLFDVTEVGTALLYYRCVMTRFVSWWLDFAGLKFVQACAWHELAQVCIGHALLLATLWSSMRDTDCA